MIVIIGLNSHYLLPEFGMLIPGYSVLACSSDIYNTSYTTFYYLAWNIIQVRKIYFFKICHEGTFNLIKKCKHIREFFVFINLFQKYVL